MKKSNYLFELFLILFLSVCVAVCQNAPSNLPHFTLGAEIQVVTEPVLKCGKQTNITIVDEMLSSKESRALAFAFSEKLLSESWVQSDWEQRDQILSKLATFDSVEYSGSQEQAFYIFNYLMHVIGGKYQKAELLNEEKTKRTIKIIRKILNSMDVKTCGRAMAACLWIEVHQMEKIDFDSYSSKLFDANAVDSDPLTVQIFYGAKFESELRNRDTSKAFKIFEDFLLPSYKKSGIIFTDNGQFRPFVSARNMFVSVDGVYNSMHLDRYFANEKAKQNLEKK